MPLFVLSADILTIVLVHFCCTVSCCFTFLFFLLQRAVGFSYAFDVKNTDFTKKYTKHVQSPNKSANYLRARVANDTVLPYVCNVDFNRNS